MKKNTIWIWFAAIIITGCTADTSPTEVYLPKISIRDGTTEEPSSGEEASITLTVVYTNDEFMALAPSLVTDLVTKARKKAEAVVKKAEEAGVKAGAVVREGEPYEAITSFAREAPSDIIVMGSQSRRGLSKLLMGSVTERTIGYAPCPVLVRHPV